MDRGGIFFRFSGRHVASGDPVFVDPGDAGARDAGGHDRLVATHGFQLHDAEGLGLHRAGEYEAVAGAEPGRDVGVVDVAGERHPVLQVQGLDLFFKLFPQGAGAADDQMIVPGQHLHSFDQIGISFIRDQAPNAENQLLAGKTAADFRGALRGGLKRLDPDGNGRTFSLRMGQMRGFPHINRRGPHNLFRPADQPVLQRFEEKEQEALREDVAVPMQDDPAAESAQPQGQGRHRVGVVYVDDVVFGLMLPQPADHLRGDHGPGGFQQGGDDEDAAMPA